MIKLSFVFMGFALLCLLVFSVALPTESQAQNPEDAKADMIKRGAQVYKARCALCHLPEGKSPNKRMQLNDTEWKHGDKPEDIEKVVAEGVKGTAMLGFKNRLQPDQIKAVSAYVMTLSEKAK